MLDHHKQLLDISTGALFRPNILLTRGPLLIVRFMANGGTGIGFKADYSFISGELQISDKFVAIMCFIKLLLRGYLREYLSASVEYCLRRLPGT